MKPPTHLDRVNAARKVIQAYENVIKATQEIIEAGPAPVKGTTVMVRTHEGFHSSTFKCSECERTCDTAGWKFCAYCGAEIIRYDLPKNADTITVYGHAENPQPKPQKIIVHTEQVKFKPVKIRVKVTDGDGVEHHETVNTFRPAKRR
jgi:hypothetical protein